jgi:hypothetical protein
LVEKEWFDFFDISGGSLSKAVEICISTKIFSDIGIFNDINAETL